MGTGVEEEMKNEQRDLLFIIQCYFYFLYDTCIYSINIYIFLFRIEMLELEEVISLHNI